MNSIIGILWKKISSEALNSTEQEMLREWIAASPYNQQVFDEISDPVWLKQDMQLITALESKSIWNKISKGIQEDRADKKLVKMRSIWQYAAAMLLILLSVFLYIWSGKNDLRNVSSNVEGTRYKNDVLPGGDKAILILSDGSRVVLDSAGNGFLRKQGEVSISKSGDGQLIYTQPPVAKPKDAKIYYNTVSTPPGGQYRVVLPDGSRVWLNASSSITFPASFSDSRDVEVSGEAYFEIEKLVHAGSGSLVPFRVKLNETEILVTGTSFNVNAYDNEQAIYTTLIEGGIKIRHGHSSGILKPGEAARISIREKNTQKVSSAGSLIDSTIIINRNADTERAIAWKNGVFIFRNSDIRSIMRQVERWYDVEVKYQDEISQPFYGEIPRDVPVSKLLKILESTGWVHFKIDGKLITVSR